MRALTSGERIQPDYLRAFLRERKITKESICRTVLIRVHRSVNPEKISQAERQALQLFECVESDFCSFSCPGECCLIPEEGKYEKHREAFRDFAEQNRPLVKIGIGTEHALIHQNRSFDHARMALNSLMPAQYVAEASLPGSAADSREPS